MTGQRQLSIRRSAPGGRITLREPDCEPGESDTLMKRAILLTALLSAIGCGGPSTTPSSAPPTSVGQFTVTDLVIGSGATAANNLRATVNYTGWLYDTGKPFG